MVAALARLLLNNVMEFSPSDEAAMLRMAAQTTDRAYSYRQACHRWLESPHLWKFPGIVRYGNVFLVGRLMRLFTNVTFRVQSSISTASGIASMALTWVIARRLAPGSETIALALASTSPLQLHLGRRALQDELVCALMLSGFAAGITGHPVLSALSLAALLSVKETTLTAFPAFLGAFWLAGVPLHSSLGPLVAAPALFVLGFCVISREPLLFPKFFRAVKAAKDDWYGRLQEGAPNRLPVDLMLVAPLVFVAACRSGMTPAVLFVLLHLGVHSIVPIMRSIRMVTASEAMLRVVAAGVIAKWDPFLAVMFLGVNAYAEYLLFRRVFMHEAVYDPVTPNLVVALGMSPKPTT